MILDSVFRIAAYELRKRNRLPKVVKVTRDGKKYVFTLPDVVSMAAHVSNIYNDRGNVEHAKFLIRRASWLVYRARKTSPIGGWVIKDKEPASLEGLNVIDLRKGYVNGLSGHAYERICAIFNKDLVQYKTTGHHYALINALAKTDAIIVDTSEESFALQDYLARRSFLTIVLTGAQVEGFYEGTKLEGFEDKKVVAHG